MSVMAGTACESGAGRSLEGTLSGEALTEWRSSEQVENGIASTSPPYWDTDDEEDCGPKPSELYGKYTWKIDKFSQINKRELRSNVFEVGNYKWYVLVYPQGCDVCNHLSLFLCVANHDKLLPGWSHYAHFTIAVVNKDPKKSKYSDTLHRFRKKEHDWGWKKFMELSKVMDGFVDADTLIIKAQVQVIRERPDRPFRCLDSHYRRELMRVYLTNVEQLCRRIVDEGRIKFVKLIEDKASWSNFCSFWMNVHPSTRLQMSMEKRDTVLRQIVKRSFVEKEVTSTLIMDFLYSGLRALENQRKSKVGSEKLAYIEELPPPIIHSENGIFVLLDDLLKLLEWASIEPLPPKDDKGPQNRMKDGFLEDFSADSIARDERRLTLLGRKTIEIFALATIFSKIEHTYKEINSLRLQEELIREEEVCLAATGQKGKQGVSEKEKKLKKKQAKQKRNNRKGKEKGKMEKPSVAVEEDLHPESVSDDDEEGLISAVSQRLLENTDKPEDVSDVSDSVSCHPEVPSHDSEEKDASWDIDALETRTPTDASSSTCSTDSIPLMGMNGHHSGYSFPKQRNRRPIYRVKDQRAGSYEEVHAREAVSGASKLMGAGRSVKTESQSKVPTLSYKGRKNEEYHLAKKELNMKGQAMEEKPFKEKATLVSPSLSTPSNTMSSYIPKQTTSKVSAPSNLVPINKPSSNLPLQADRATSVVNAADSTSSEAHKVIEKPTNKPSAHQSSRPLSAPIAQGPKPPTSTVSHAQTTPMLSRSASATGRLAPSTSSSSIPLSYKNAILGITQSGSESSSSSHKPSKSQTQMFSSSSSAFNPLSHAQASNPPSTLLNSSKSHTQVSQSPSSLFRPSQSHSQASHNSSRSSLHPSQLPTQGLKINSPERNDQEVLKSSISLGVVDQNLLRNGPLSIEIPQSENMIYPGLVNVPQNALQERTNHSGLGDDFPHLDIINNLLDEEQGLRIENFHNLQDGDPRFDQYYCGDGYGHEFGYGSLAGQFESLGVSDMIPQINPGMYMNELIDGYVPNQWQMGSADVAYYSGMSADVGGNYPYNYRDYANVAYNVRDYTGVGPSNAH